MTATADTTKALRPARTSLHLKKSLGQHFLRDRDAAARIARLLPTDRLIVEIGPGDGALTQELFLHGNRVLAIEVDAEMIPLLKRRFHRQKETFQLIVADALRIDWVSLAEEHGTNAITGNLPYNIASQIIIRVFDAIRRSAKPVVSEIVVTVQKEVGERLTASPGSKAYGALTILTYYHAESEYLFTIPAGDFFPKPQVDGGVIRLKLRKPGEFPKVDYLTFRRIVRGCFAQRRKVLSNSLKVVNDLPEGWKDIDIDWNRRAEQLKPEEFIDLTNQLILLGLPISYKGNHDLEEGMPDADL